ncbi:hypothetical protein NG831_16715 [Xanthomonas sacchari]|uniref:hypothetical protein n=1 Tax=Xanthomonas TaxID=338 RepID=UPI00186B2BF0|nr:MULTISPECIES: hypothetical protein [Xanthomonas]UYK65799.1 hypothetical protein NG831_16715 [Xanthomonas sacchari]UYK83962.1 hypothetical protein NG827_16080 [Xanthomonas sacchari]
MKKILARRAMPVVPTALHNMWTSMWSKCNARLRQQLCLDRHAHSASCQTKATA